MNKPARVLVLLGIAAALSVSPAASTALATDSPSSNLKISIAVTNLDTGQPLADRQTVAAGTPFRVSVTSDGVDCAGQFVVTALGVAGAPPSVLVQVVPFIIDGSAATGTPLVAGVLPSGVNDLKISASCNGATPKSFANDAFEFFVVS